MVENGENLIEENKKYKNKIIELRDQIKKLEQTEKKLKDLILEKEVKIDEERLEYNKILESDYFDNQINTSTYDFNQSQCQYAQLIKSNKSKNSSNLEEDSLMQADTIDTQQSATGIENYYY